jgi:putative DNA primase/helicase
MDEFDDRFAPLTESELTAAQAGDDAPKDEGECVMPVPPDAPRMPSEHPKLGMPSAHWPYRDAAGCLLFEVWRFDPAGERKTFKPLSLWRDASGALRWHWKSVPAPRPLYGLDRLAASPGASVVVCEGEKAVDSATLIFPKSVCITSAGGCKAEATANFEPLAGRRVLIWPDADEVGAKCASEVAAILHGLGCEVSIIDAVALASMAPDGGQREPEKGWDAAKAAEQWPDMVALRKAACGFAKPFEAGPEFVSWGPFKMDATASQPK